MAALAMTFAVILCSRDAEAKAISCLVSKLPVESDALASSSPNL
ncbi:hypothetical protein TIFTF001_052973 [Ficus carica]|uniref:Uncharacterized protein n=1 Tax=Ficus carica TaxID=3494 RepID=A0AA88EH12_FICCA|nr:hypothetical protein TIFTF001_052973 [Ficus carica]